MWEEAGVVVIGPGWEILGNTGDKLKARELAEANAVPVLPALREPTNSVESLKKFANEVGYPIMAKAVDGGGGRGIRLIRSEADLENSARRAIEESPSKQVFAEKAAVDGFRHVEVQIVGDGTGDVRHLWERECSIQRRYQKVVEIAPSTLIDRAIVTNVIKSALRMAKAVRIITPLASCPRQLLTGIVKLSLPRNIRVFGLSNDWRILFSRGKPTPSSGAYDYRSFMFKYRPREASVTHCSRPFTSIIKPPIERPTYFRSAHQTQIHTIKTYS